MRIILTSFRDAKNWKGTTCSIARWQPDWSSMPELPVNIMPWGLSDKMNPGEYRIKYNKILENKTSELTKFFLNIENDATIIMCCWCNPERQPYYNGKLMCHRILLGYWIEEHFNFATVKYADGAENSIWEKEK